MHRFFEGFLCPPNTGGVVVPFRSEAAEAMWIRFASLWRSVNPNSTSYNFMGPPLLSGDVWIAFDHIARVLDALRQKPNEFVAFPAPAGPKGRGYMPLLVGLAVVRDGPDMGARLAARYTKDRRVPGPIEHDAEKWVPVFRKDHAQTKR